MHPPIVPLRSITLALFLGPLAAAYTKEPAVHYDKPEELQSPNGKYAITVPVITDEIVDGKPAYIEDGENSVVRRSTGKVVTVIKQDRAAFTRTLNHHGTGEASWSDDSSLLLWKIDGRWFFDSLILIKIDKEKNKASWQLDLMKTGQQAILKRTKKSAPEAYAAFRKSIIDAEAEHQLLYPGDTGGSAYPEGFSIQVDRAGDEDKPITLPMILFVDLIADKKGSINDPTNLTAHLDAVVSKDGKFTVTDFKLGPRPLKDGNPRPPWE